MSQDIFSKFNIAKLTVREAIMQMCFTTIALCLLVPVIGWLATLGLWILLAINNFEQFRRSSQYADRAVFEGLVRDMIVKQVLLKRQQEGEVWDANAETKPEEENNDV